MIENILIWLLKYYIKHYLKEEQRWEFDMSEGKAYAVIGYQPNTNKPFVKIS